MASVNFKKIKSGTEGARLIRHCSKDTRSRDNHANEHINKAQTSQNQQIIGTTYEGTVQRWKDRIAELDATTNTNKRKDRVELFALELPVPDGVAPEEFARFSLAFFRKKYSEQNVLNVYLHTDEKHLYYDGHEAVVSKDHIHAFIVPEINGKLNGKEFSSRKQMKLLNQQIDAICRQRWNCSFLKYAPEEVENHKTEFGYTVEELKKKSFVDELALKSAKNQAIELIESCTDVFAMKNVLRGIKNVLEPEKQVPVTERFSYLER